MRMKTVLVLAMLALSTSAFAATVEDAKPVFGKKTQPADFPELIAMIRMEVKPGGRWETVPDRDRPLLEQKLSEMEDILEGHESVADLADDAQLRLINAQGHANAILTQNDGHRLICERIKPVGSHRPVKQCMTVAQRRQANEDSRRYLERNPPRMVALPPGPNS
jgi:hypothetical protein